MENIGRLFGQVAAEAGVTEAKAKRVTYLFGLSARGATIGAAAAALRCQPATIKTMSRNFLIDFADYRPFARERDKGVVIPARVKLSLGA